MPNTTNRVKLPYVMQSQSQKEVTLNSGFDLIDGLLQAAVVSVNVNTPPALSSAGTCYVVGTAPTGVWAGQAKTLAIYSTAWTFTAPWEGLTMLGVNTTADNYTKFIAKSDASLFDQLTGSVRVMSIRQQQGILHHLYFRKISAVGQNLASLEVIIFR